MTKPLGYYTSYTPGDCSYLELIQQKYGAQLENITNFEKLYLISVLAAQLCNATGGDLSSVRNEIYRLGVEVEQQLDVSDRAGLVEAMIAQLRWGQQHEPAVHKS